LSMAATARTGPCRFTVLSILLCAPECNSHRMPFCA
jgi:hypothetical protein